jgi:hypothetical protein
MIKGATRRSEFEVLKFPRIALGAKAGEARRSSSLGASGRASADDHGGAPCDVAGAKIVLDTLYSVL